jgi:hypothetical protein
MTLGAVASLHDSAELVIPEAIPAAMTEALAVFREIGDGFGEAHTLIGFSQLALLREDTAAAESFLAEAERIVRSEGNWFTLTDVLLTRARSAIQFGESARAEPVLREGLRYCLETRDVWTAMLTIAGLAIVASRAGDHDQAVRLFGSADALREQTGVGLSWWAWQNLADQSLAAARAVLDDETFAVLWSEGRSRGLQGAMEHALEAGITAA